MPRDDDALEVGTPGEKPAAWFQGASMEAALLPDFEHRLRGSPCALASSDTRINRTRNETGMDITNPGRNAPLRNFPQQWSKGTAVGFLASLFFFYVSSLIPVSIERRVRCKGLCLICWLDTTDALHLHLTYRPMLAPRPRFRPLAVPGRRAWPPKRVSGPGL